MAITLVAVLCGLVGATPATSAGPRGEPDRPPAPILDEGHPDAVPGSFIVGFQEGFGTSSASATHATAATLRDRYRLHVRFTYTAALKGLAVRDATPQQVRQLTADPAVAYVAQDLKAGHAAATAFTCPPDCLKVQGPPLPPPSWNLDRVDQRSLPLDLKYHYPSTASTVRAYIIDSGIRYSHNEFGGRAVAGFDAFGGSGLDCQGHGTHMAGVVGGSTVGMAKQITLVSVRVLNCDGSGTIGSIIAGVDWVTGEAIRNPRPSVAVLGLSTAFSAPLNTAITNSINANVHYSVAAGNANADAANFSPGSTPRATTVAASNSSDARATFSNYGTLVDLYAPGVSVSSAWMSSDSAYNSIAGTSMAAAHAAGAAALWRHRFPADTADQVAAALGANATPNVITGNPAQTRNLLLFMGMIPV